MKSNIIRGLIVIGALSLGSCSTAKLASDQTKDDDVYYSEAKAGDQPEYRPQTQQQTYNNNTDDDYYYYGSYASRINRFGYVTPFNYYDDFYYGYSPYSAYNNYYNGFGLGIGFGYGYGSYYGGYGYGGYSPYGISFGYGYGGYSPYSYYGTGYGYGYGGYGGGGYWGTVSAYSSVNRARPARGTGAPGNGVLVNRTIGYNGSYPADGYPGRPVANSSNGRQSVNSTGYSSNNNNNNGRPVRQDAPRPVYQPQTQQSYSPPASTSSSGSSSAGSSSSGGGGGRPVRP